MRKEHFELLSKLYPEDFNNIRNKNKILLEQLKNCDDDCWEIRRKIRHNVEEMIRLLNGIK